MTKPQVAVVGARGYSGVELCRLLLQHPDAKLAGIFATNDSYRLEHSIFAAAAKRVPTWSMEIFEQKLETLHTVFLATPAEVSLELAPVALAKGVNVIDLSGAFRLNRGSGDECVETYRKWYGFDHQRVELLLKAQYGLQPFASVSSKVSEESDFEFESGAALIANPGCFATAVLMALIPLLRAELVQPESIVIDAKSGASGAGRKASENLLFTEVEGECLPYRVGRHQHWPEIVQKTWVQTGVEIAPFFTTHLLNVRRGIIASIYASLNSSFGGLTDREAEEKVTEAFSKAFESYELVRFGALGSPETDALLSLKRVVGSPYNHLSYRVEGGKLYLFSVLDNLAKGAASQAVENFNRLIDAPCGWGLSGMEGGL